MGHSNLRSTLLVLIFLAITPLLFPQTTAFPAPDADAAKLISQSREWLHDLRNDGFSFQGLIVYDWSKSAVKQQGTEEGFGRYSFDLSMPVDGRRALGWEGSAGLVRLKNHIRLFGEIDDGAAQLPSNIDSCSRTMLYELWFEQRLLSNKLRLKGGKIDSNTEFDVVQTAGDFLNSSMGYSPTILAFPTYPEPKPGVAAFLQPTSRNALSLGVFQTAGMGTLSIVEPGRSWNVGQGERPGRASFGYWRLDGQLAQFDGGHASGTQGFYSVVEQSGWRYPWPGRGRADERKLSTFFQFGYAQGEVSPFTRHAGGGAVLQAPFGRRSRDAFGIAATYVRFSSHSGAGFDLDSELVWESYYKWTIGKHVALIPDFQFLHQPGGLLANRDCPLLNSRVVFSF